MNEELLNKYQLIRGGGHGFYEQDRGLIAVRGKEAVAFLDGLITNNVKLLADGEQMMAAFPNAQGRLLAVVRVLRQGDRFLFETESSTREKVFQNLFRFTFAGDFFVEDLSDRYRYFEMYGGDNSDAATPNLAFTSQFSTGLFIPVESVAEFRDRLSADALEIPGDLYETLRIENGVPFYGVDMDETTIVPELGLDALISYTKGCYIGQEIIARIHFRGHVAKRLTGLILDQTGGEVATDLTSIDGKNAGRVTSITFSPSLDAMVAIGYVRYDYLPEGTGLRLGDQPATVKDLPMVSPSGLGN